MSRLVAAALLSALACGQGAAEPQPDCTTAHLRVFGTQDCAGAEAAIVRAMVALGDFVLGPSLDKSDRWSFEEVERSMSGAILQVGGCAGAEPIAYCDPSRMCVDEMEPGEMTHEGAHIVLGCTPDHHQWTDRHLWDAVAAARDGRQ